MNSKSNRSYKLRTKQMAIHVRASGQINKPVITTKVEEGLFTIDDLRNRKCAIINDCSDMILQAVLAYAFPTDHSICRGTYDYYYAYYKDVNKWSCGFTTSLPTQSAIKFFNQINK